MAALTAALLGFAGGAAYKSLTQKGPDMPSPVAPPAAPTADPLAQEKAARIAAKLASARTGGGVSSTLLTGPSGLSGPAPVATKSLLGQ